jgi:predicted  nucleic acid-binding Zn-ribbon protein
MRKINSDKMVKMSFPIKTCVACGEEFELKPGKPGFANRCPECSAPEAEPDQKKQNLSTEERKAEAEANAERRKAIRDLLYKKDR